MIKNIFLACMFACFVFFPFTACKGSCEMRGMGVIHLTVIDENGNPLKDEYAKNFIIKMHNSALYRRNEEDNPRLVINEKDDLIFQMGYVPLIHNECKRIQNKEDFTDEEIKNAIENAGIFSIKDKTNKYETEVDVKYKDCYVSFKRIYFHDTLTAVVPKFIYYCEIRMKKK